jgi:hypothetical protein
MAKATNTCSACAHWEPVQPEPTHGRCRAHPPIAISSIGHSAWPTTLPSDWCGLFESAPLPEKKRS